MYKKTNLSQYTSTLLYCSLIVVLGSLSYISSLNAGFLSLDDLGILDMLQSNEISPRSLFLCGGGDYFRPITMASFMLDLRLFGRDPLVFHSINLIFHIINSLLIYTFVTQTLETCAVRRTAACLAALVFAVHPVNTEAVMWVAARTDLLCCFFVLLALIAGFAKDTGDVRAASAFFLMYLCSLLSKEASIAIVLILPTYCLLNRKHIPRNRSVVLCVATGAATTLYLFMRSGFSSGPDRGVVKVINGSKHFSQLLYENLAAFGFYIKKMFLPLPLNFAIVSIDTRLYIWVGILAVLIIFFLVVRFVSLRLPVLVMVFGLIPPLLALHGKLPWTPYAERYVYFSTIGLSLTIGVVITCWGAWTRWVALVIILACSITTAYRVALWSDPKAFWTDVMVKSPEFPRSYVGVAVELMKESRYDEAQTFLEKSLSMGYEKDFIWSNLANIYLARKDFPAYEKAAGRAADLSANPTRMYIGLIQVLVNNVDHYGGKYELYNKVAGYYKKAFEKDPKYIDGLYNAAKSYMYINEDELALKYFRQFLDAPGETMYKPFARRLMAKIETKPKVAQ